MEIINNILGMNLTVEMLIVFISIGVIVLGQSYALIKFEGLRLFIAIIFITILGGIYFFFKVSFIPILLPYIIAPSFLIGLLIGISNVEKKAEPLVDVEIRTRKGKRIIRNVFAGVGIFGASRSGKTASAIYSLLLHFSKFNFSGLIYDYKNGELTEICLPLFGERVKIFAIHKPDIGVRINPINPKYLYDEKDVTAVTKVLLDNLSGDSVNKGGDNFFDKTAESLLSALILKFSLYHQHYCTLPHIIAFILSVDFSLKTEEAKGLKDEAYGTFEGLRKFLTDDGRVRIQASSFVLGLASEKQTAGVISTLANSLRTVAFPEAFWALSGNELDLNINHKENQKVFTILNEPKSEEALTPVLATVLHTVTKQMMVRGQEPAFILLDEAPTIKLKNMARISATMASFKIATIYCAQDISQAVIQYTRDGFKAILANLSTLFFGRANDPDTGKFYEQYFEPKKIKTHSRTKGNSNASTTVGEREVPKIRAHEFTKFVPGQFAFLSGGKAEMIRFPKFDIEVEVLKENKNQELRNRIIENYRTIIEEINMFAEQIGLSEKR